jgi:hypothetical protein
MLGNNPPTAEPEIPDEISWGTHSIPRKFWGDKKEPLLKSEEGKAKRAAKHEQHIRNVSAKIEENRKLANK